MVATSELLRRDITLVRHLVGLYISGSARRCCWLWRQGFVCKCPRPRDPYRYSQSNYLLMPVLLMFVSGLTLQEVPNAKRRYQKSQNWEAYSEYLRRTSILYPLPPALYAPLPKFLKRTLLLEFPIYVFHPSKEDENERRKSRDERDRTKQGREAGLVGNN